MKIWGNDLNVGDTIYYEYDLDIRQSTVAERDTKTFKMPLLIMKNGDRLFVNNYFYTEKQEVIDNVLEELKIRVKQEILSIEHQLIRLEAKKTLVNNKLKELEEFN